MEPPPLPNRAPNAPRTPLAPLDPMLTEEQIVQFAVDRLADGLSPSDLRTEMFHRGVPEETIYHIVDLAVDRGRDLPARRKRGLAFIGIGVALIAAGISTNIFIPDLSELLPILSMLGFFVLVAGVVILILGNTRR